MSDTLPKFPTPFTFSQSSLQDYADCPRRFQLRYLEHLIYPAEETAPALENEQHQQEGQFFHRLVQQYLIGILPEKLSKLANTPNLQRWWENFINAESLNGLTNLPRTYPEVTLSAPLGDQRLLAKYDLVAFTPEGKAVIYDWKTYRKRPRTESLAAHWQTRVYRSLLIAAGSHLNGNKPIAPERCEMVYWFANFPNEPVVLPYSKVQYQRDWDALTKLTEEILSAASYPLTDDRQKCAYCPYRSYCDRGIRAGDPDSIEVEMDVEAQFDINFEQIGEIEF